MEDVFAIVPEDSGFVCKFKREANTLLASLANDEGKYSYYHAIFCDALPVISALGNIEIDNEGKYLDDVLAQINRFWNVGILSPLTLKDEEFGPVIKGDYLVNNRYRWIHKKESTIINTNSYNLFVRKAYNHNELTEIKVDPYTIEHNHRIFINKGGVVTGENIITTIIPANIVNQGRYTIQSIVNIPVSVIFVNDRPIFTVDHREPKLKALQEFYTIPTYFNKDVAELRLNIRKYKKL